MDIPKKILLLLGFVGLAGLIWTKPFQFGLELNNSRAAAISGATYNSTALFAKTNLTLSIIPIDYNQATRKWNYKISWDRQSGRSGSFLIKSILYLADASGRGEAQTDYNLKAKTKYSIIYYSKSSKGGTVVFSKFFTTLPAPNLVIPTNPNTNPTQTFAPIPVLPNTTPIPIPIPTPISTCKVYTYQDKFYYGVGKHCLDRITIQGVYFIAKNQTTGIKSYWKDNMLNIFTQIKNFYESQFNNKLQIIISTPVTIYGDKSIEEYNQYSIEQEIRQKVLIDTANSFVVSMFYPVQGENDKRVIGDFGGGSGVSNGSSAMNNYGWLDTESLGTITTKYGTDYSGYIGSAHEFGHTLGLPHPWDEEINKDSKGNIINQDYGNDEIGSLMSYTGQRGPLIPNSFIRSQVKQKMIVP